MGDEAFRTVLPYIETVRAEIPYETAGKRFLQQFWSKCGPELLFQPPYQCVVRTDTRSPAEACRFAPTAHGQSGRLPYSTGFAFIGDDDGMAQSQFPALAPSASPASRSAAFSLRGSICAA
jgi:hypothetical protein